MNEYDRDERGMLLRIAADSIRHGLSHGGAAEVELSTLPDALKAPRACFVTLNINGNLRGCIGSLQPERPLAEDVAENAYAAAFSDPRFPSLGEAEFPHLELHISVLTLPVDMEVADEVDLLAQLRPGVDGLVLKDGFHRATFLPSVWEQLPEPGEFLSHLKLKAGLSTHYWSDGLKFQRYTTESFGAHVKEIMEAE